MTTKLSDLLHDIIDKREELAEAASQRAADLVREKFPEALDSTDSLEDALTLLAAWVAQDLDPITTKAARDGARLEMRLIGRENKS